ncbi:MAG TPA: hypothetical protein VFE78_33860 [Gemmataceae bacterium]|nr:hypothetical protein [Gemmataceae bacterium]
MTGIVLALAGLTCGDGGPGMVAATATVAPNLDGPWTGTVRFNGSAPYQMEFVKGGMRVRCRWGTALVNYDLVSSRQGSVRLSYGSDPCLGTFRLEGGRLALSLGGKAAEFWGEYFERYRDSPPPVPLP